MELTGWLLFLLLVGVVGLIIYKSVEDDSDSAAVILPPDTPPPKEPLPKTFQPDPVKKEEAGYVTIYKYSPPRSFKRCASCDGENNPSASICHICGNEIDS